MIKRLQNQIRIIGTSNKVTWRERAKEDRGQNLLCKMSSCHQIGIVFIYLNVRSHPIKFKRKPNYNTYTTSYLRIFVSTNYNFVVVCCCCRKPNTGTSKVHKEEEIREWADGRDEGTKRKEKWRSHTYADILACELWRKRNTM